MGQTMNTSFHSVWSEHEGLPTAWVETGSGDPCAYHPLAGWRMKAEVYLDGSVRPLSAEFGSRYFAPAPFHVGHRRARLIIGDTDQELDLQRLRGVRWMFGPACAQAMMPMADGVLHVEILVKDLEARAVMLCWSWRASNLDRPAPRLMLPTNLAGATRRGDCLGADLPHYGRVGWAAQGANLAARDGAWLADLSAPLFVRVAYDPAGADPPTPRASEFDEARVVHRLNWRKLLDRVEVRPGCDPVEIRWSMQLLAGTAFHDGSRGFNCTGNGHLYLLDHRSPVLDQSGGGISFRDGNQVAWSLARIVPALARDQVLRSAAASCPRRGIPQMSNATPGRDDLWKAPGGEHGGAPVDELASPSEQVWWWALALAEVLDVEGSALLGVAVTACDGWTAPLSAHLDRLLAFAWDRVGVGAHGIPRMLSGDWNDWLGRIGCQGRGESFMNAGLAVVAQLRLAAALCRAGDTTERRGQLRRRAEALRAACAPFGGGPWWPRAIADDGALVGDTVEGRVYLDGTPWMSLARLGDPARRAEMLLGALRRCDTPIGPAIIDRPLDRDGFPRRTHCLYPPGAGENGGVWWIVGQWMALALDDAGLANEAMELHQRCSRANHHRLFPGEWWSPFMAPDGLDGPASPHFGRAQQAAEAYPQPWAQGFDRTANPHEVAKWAYQVGFATGRSLGTDSV